jgi:hypothetical protein
MTCHEARELFSALVDETAPAEERARAEAHLAGCADCPRELARFRATVALLRSVVPARAPAGFVERVTAAAAPARPRRRLARAFLPLALKLPTQAAALVMVAVLVGYLFRHTPELERAARFEPEAPRPPASASDALTAAPGVKAAPPTAPVPAPEPTRLSKAPTPAPRPAPAPEPAAAAPKTAVREAAKDAGNAEGARHDLGAAERREDQQAGHDAAGARREADGMAARAAPAERETAGPARSEPKALRALAPAEAPRAKERAFVEARVSGALAVTDRAVAAEKLRALVTGLGGDYREPLGDAAAVEIILPGAAWADFVRGLAGIGRWAPDHEPAAPSDRVRVTLRITG